METFVEQGFEGFEAKALLCRARVVAARGRGAKPRRAPRCHTDSDILARYPSQDLVHPFARRKSARGIAAPLTTDRNVSPVLETSTAPSLGKRAIDPLPPPPRSSLFFLLLISGDSNEIRRRGIDWKICYDFGWDGCGVSVWREEGKSTRRRGGEEYNAGSPTRRFTTEKRGPRRIYWPERERERERRIYAKIRINSGRWFYSR